jgi:GNAT superfamily N-acetyltransferase
MRRNLLRSLRPRGKSDFEGCCLSRFSTAWIPLDRQLHSVVCAFSVFGPSRDDDATPNVGEVFALHVAPTSWGRGVGSTLLRRTLEQLRASGSVGVSLWVIDGNARARRFYEHQGWHLDGTQRTSARIADSPLREVRYRIAFF